MIEYKICKDNTYIDIIVKHLRAHNDSHTGERKRFPKFLYLLENKQLVAGLEVYYSWDWVSIGHVKYRDMNDLKHLFSKVCDIFKDEAVGLRFNSYFKDVVDSLDELGFTQTHIVKYSPKLGNFYTMELRELNITSESNEEIIVLDDKNEDYSKLLEEETNKRKEKFNVKDKVGDLTIVAHDKEEFAGGVYGILYEDHMYIDLLVVNKDYKGRGIGTELMNRIEEEVKDTDIVSISLGTAEFQARPFYEKLGYITILKQPDFPRGFACYTLVKDIK